MKIKKDSKDLVKGTISGGWDLLKNGSKYDMLVTLNQVIDFSDTETFSNGDEWSMFTCYNLSDYLKDDHCWLVEAKRSNNKWEYTSTMFDDDDIEDDDGFGEESGPEGDSDDIIWQAKWKDGKASTVKVNKDYKTYNQLITESSGNKITSKLQFMVRDKDLYKKFLDGHDLETKSVIWVADSDTDLDDDEGDELEFKKASSAEKALVSSSSKYNLVAGSTTGMSTFCSATNNGSNECIGSICSKDSECQTKFCSSKVCTKAPTNVATGSTCTADSQCVSKNCNESKRKCEAKKLVTSTVKKLA